MSNNKLFPSTIQEYNQDKTNLSCIYCNLFFHVKDCIPYTTNSGNRTYPTCPRCKTKYPMRSTPRFKRAYRKRVEPKRIE